MSAVSSLVKRIESLEQRHKNYKLTRHLKIEEDYAATIYTEDSRKNIYYYPSETAKSYHLKKSGVKGVMGPVGQGKSSFNCWDLVFSACEMPPCIDGVRRYKAAIIRKTFDELKTTTFQTIYHWFNMLGVVKPTMSSPMTFKSTFNDGFGLVELEFIFRACANEKDLEKIKSLEVTEVWINEITDIFSDLVIKNAQTRQNRYPSDVLIDYDSWSISTSSSDPDVPLSVHLDFDGTDITYTYLTFNAFRRSGVIATDRIDKSLQEEVIDQFNIGRFSGEVKKNLLSIMLFNPCLRIDTNPPDESHFFYKLFTEIKPRNWELFKQPPAMIKVKDAGPVDERYKLNPSADNYKYIKASYYYDMISSMTDDEVNVFIMGEFGSVSSGQPVYPEFFRKNHISKESLYDSSIPLHLGFDFGSTPACVVLQTQKNGWLNIVGERWTRKSSLQHFIVAELNPYLNENFPGAEIESSVYDPSGITKQEATGISNFMILEENNFKPVPFSLMKKRVVNTLSPRINAVRKGLTTLIEGRMQLVVDKSCNLLIAGLAGKYHYSERKPGVLTDKPEKDDYSHTQDALQYVIMNKILTTVKKKNIKDYSIKVV